MCAPGLDPFTIAAIAGSVASAGGAKMNADAQNDAIRAQNAENQKAMQAQQIAREEEAQRQLSMEGQQTDEVAKSLVKANPAGALMRAKQTVAAPDNAITGSAGSYNEEPQAPPIQNKDVSGASAGYEKKSVDTTKTVLDALAMLSALGGETAAAGDAVGRSNSNIQTIGGNRRGSLNANAAETRIPAPTVTANPGLMGDLLMLGGGAGAQYAGSKMGAGPKKPPKLTDAELASLSSGGLY
ncbi:hypothetical protein [uncultured Amaricoccus sp.]|uniref:hypothetical protein n=1 Tax=uncultured Amaricoccus sp. TaxID=339341 RepID=UPI00261B0704|nr:hypothetical protein [uncultured Amaricoccus sp.]